MKSFSSHRALFVSLVSLTVLLFFFNRGFTYHDEGHVLHAVQRVLDGEVVYRDFDWIYPPGSVYVTALVFRFFGESILIGRILMLAVAALTSVVIFKIARHVLKTPFWIAFASSLMYLSWGPSHINFPWPVMFAIASASTAFLLFSLGSKSGRRNYFLLGGAMIALTFLFKQNFGLAAVINSAAVFYLTREKGKERLVVSSLLGFFTVVAVYVVYLAARNTIDDFINWVFRVPFEQVVLGGVFSTPFVDEPRVLFRAAKIAFYLIPAIVSVLAIVASWTRRADRKQSFLFSFVLFFYIFGIRPTTDYVHLVPLLSLTGIPLAYLIKRYGDWPRGFLIRVFTIVLIMVGFYTAFFKGYYRWETPLARQNRYMVDERARVFVDEKYDAVINTLVPVIRQHTKPDDFIFVFYNAPMFYFLSDRKNPTHYFSLEPGDLSAQREQKLLEELISKKVRVIITHESMRSKTSPIADYIQSEFSPIKETYEFIIWARSILESK